MATDKQIEANRLNAMKSTGPKTEEGKASSRRNYLHHGLAALQLLPAQDEEAAAGRASAWSQDLGARTPFQEFLVGKMAEESVRADRCGRHYDDLKVQEGARAETCWDRDKAAEAEKLGRRLAHDPVMVTGRLGGTPHGCTWLIMQWTAWIGEVEAKGMSEALKVRSLDLQGVPPELREGLAVSTDVASARSEVARLKSQASRMAPHDDFVRDMAECGLAPDDQEARRVRRCESGCMRRLQWAHTQLVRSQQGKAASKRPASWAGFDFAGPGTVPAASPSPAAPRTNPIGSPVASGSNPIPPSPSPRIDLPGVSAGSSRPVREAFSAPSRPANRRERRAARKLG